MKFDDQEVAVANQSTGLGPSKGPESSTKLASKKGLINDYEKTESSVFSPSFKTRKDNHDCQASNEALTAV